jgi:hypothetical protein
MPEHRNSPLLEPDRLHDVVDASHPSQVPQSGQRDGEGSSSMVTERMVALERRHAHGSIRGMVSGLALRLF